MSQQRINIGGTSGGFGEFFFGLLLVLVGLYMAFTNTVVYTSFWDVYGYNLFGPLIILFLLGVVRLAMNGASWLGWTLCSSAMLAMAVGIIMNLRFHFKNSSLLSVLIMFAVPAIGFGLILRSLRDHRATLGD